MATQYFVTVPGQKKAPIIISDTATVRDFSRAVFEATGVRLFQGFGYKGQSGTVHSFQEDATIETNTQVWDGTSKIGFGTYLIPAPAAPVLAAVTGTGSLVAATYYCKVTYVNPTGETVASAEANVVLGSTGEIVVTSPAAYADATGYNVYMSTSTGTEKLQNGATPVVIGTNYTRTTALATVTAPPSTNTATSPVQPSTVFSALGVSSGDELIVFGVPQGG